MDQLLEQTEALHLATASVPQALSERDVFGLMREMLLVLEMQSGGGRRDYLALAQALPQVMPPTGRLPAFDQWMYSEGLTNIRALEAVLTHLGITLTIQQKQQIFTRLMTESSGLVDAKHRELQELDFNSIGGVLECLPDPPKRSVTSAQLRDARIARCGGVHSKNGKGVIYNLHY